ncbi:MAG: cytochrome c maturation protein CcmE [Candidatus Nanopelagicales bacterium]
MGSEVQAPPASVEPPLEASRSRAVFVIVAVVLGVVVLGSIAVSAIGGSVLYYKTPSEILQQHPNQPVRLAGKLVSGTQVTHGDGSVTFDVTDGKATVHVRYTGGATTALQSAARPGAQMVAEGALSANNIFESTNLIAKCPSKFATAAPSTHASVAAAA